MTRHNLPSRRPRIVLSCLQGRSDHGIPAYGFWRTYFIEGCAEASIECLEVPGVDWAEGLACTDGEQLVSWRDRTWTRALEFVKREQAQGGVDLFLSYLYPRQIEVGAISTLLASGIPCANFFCDNVREFRKVPTEFRPFSIHWVPEFEALPMYRAARVSFIHAPMPCWIPRDLRSAAREEVSGAVFVGSGDELRRELLMRLHESGEALRVYGSGWSAERAGEPPLQARGRLPELLRNQWRFARRHGLLALGRKLSRATGSRRQVELPESVLRGAIWGEEYIRVSQEAEVAIGINRVPSARASLKSPLTYSRLRDIEAPMMGACYLTEWTAGLEHLYELGKEVESYRGPEDLAEKVKELRRQPERRKHLRSLGQRRALGTHSVAQSLRRLLEQAWGHS